MGSTRKPVTGGDRPSTSAPARKEAPRASESESWPGFVDMTNRDAGKGFQIIGGVRPPKKFRWTNLSRGLARELARAAGVRVSLPREDLAAKFGEPPTDQLVRDIWPTLRDRWLASRPAFRKRVVAELRAAGLGDASVKVDTKTGQMEYLRSCHQSDRLKQIVLAAFLEEGSRSMLAPAVATVSSRRGRTAPGPSEGDTLGPLRAALAGMTVESEAALELALRDAVVDFVREFEPPKPEAAFNGALRLATCLRLALTRSPTPDVLQAVPASPHREKVVQGAHRLAAGGGHSWLMTRVFQMSMLMLSEASLGAGDVAPLAVILALASIASEDDPNDSFDEIAEGTAWLWRPFMEPGETVRQGAERAVKGALAD